MKNFIGVFLISILLLIGLFLLGITEKITLTSALYAVIINLINTSAAIAFFELSKKKSNQLFLIANFGGIGLRMFIVLISIIITIKFLIIDVYAFILVFFIFYFILLFFEIKYFARFNKQKNHFVK